MSSTDSVVTLFLTPHLTIDLSPLEAKIVTGKTDIQCYSEQGPSLEERLKPYATKVLAAIAACHGRTQAVVLSAAAICVLRCADLLMGDPWTPGVVTEGKAISLVPDRSGYALVAKGRPEGTLFGLTILSEKDTHFFPISDGTANAKVDADIVSRLETLLHAECVAAGEAAGVSQAALTVKVAKVKTSLEKHERAKLLGRRGDAVKQVRAAVDAVKALGGDDATEYAARELMIIASQTDRALFDKWCGGGAQPDAGTMDAFYRGAV